MQDALFVLGAADPEMTAIKRLLVQHGVPLVRVRVDGRRVHPAVACAALPPAAAMDLRKRGGRVRRTMSRHSAGCAAAMPRVRTRCVRAPQHARSSTGAYTD